MRHDEDYLQIGCVTWFTYQFPQYWRLLHHSPNGGRRNALEAKRFKAMGVRAGFPDLILLVPSGEYHGLCIELKTKRGTQRESQKIYQSLVEGMGFRYVVIRSFEEFKSEVEDYLSKRV